MKTYEATETAYKNGYEQGKKDAEDEILILKQKRANVFEILDAYERGRANALKWIPVSERLPEYEEPVMGWDAEMRDMGIVNFIYGKFFDILDMSETNVTHWMPLPEPPKGE